MSDDVPLICDPVPNQYGGVIAIPFEISPETAAELKAIWIAAYERQDFRQLQSTGDVQIVYPQRTEWPDAEFCAA